MEASVIRQLPKANWKERLLLALGKRRAFRVEGDSMLPTLKDGEAVLIDPASTFGAGDIVVARHPFKKSVLVVKRVESIAGDRCLLVGDNAAESSDSRQFGSVSLTEVLGKAACRL
jgi:nickel-type superoxide dismutase maturation protease